MTDPQPSCPRCHLYLSARGCTPEVCANPEGAAELERLRATEREALLAMLEKAGVTAEAGEAADGTLVIGVKRAKFLFDAAGKQRESRTFVAPGPTDLDVFRTMLERAGVRFIFEPAKGPERRDPLFGDALTIRRADNNGDVDAMVSFVFNRKTGALMAAGVWGDE